MMIIRGLGISKKYKTGIWCAFVLDNPDPYDVAGLPFPSNRGLAPRGVLLACDAELSFCR